MAINLKATHIQIIPLLQTVHVNLNATCFTGIVCIVQALKQFQCWVLEKGNWNMHFFLMHVRLESDYFLYKKRDKASDVCCLWLNLTSFYTNYVGCSSTAALNSVYKSYFDRYMSPILGPNTQLLTPWYHQALNALKGGRTKQNPHRQEPRPTFTSCLYMCSAARSLCRAQPWYTGMQLTDKQASVAHRGKTLSGKGILRWLRIPMQHSPELA